MDLCHDCKRPFVLNETHHHAFCGVRRPRKRGTVTLTRGTMQILGQCGCLWNSPAERVSPNASATSYRQRIETPRCTQHDATFQTMTFRPEMTIQLA